MQYILHITKSCNFSCDYCTVPKSDIFMDRSVWTKVADFALDNAMKNFDKSVSIGFYGGEPLLHKGLIYEMVNYCLDISEWTNVKFDFMITTNGWLLDDDFIRFSAAHNIEIGISIDGMKKVHDMHRKTISSLPTFDHVYEACEKLIAKIPNSYAMLTVNPDTVTSLFQSVKFLYKSGFNTIVTTPNLSIIWSPEDFRLLKHQYKLISDWYKDKLTKGKKINLPIFDNKLVNQIGLDKCIPAKHRMSIDVNGDIYPCIQYVDRDRYKIGYVDKNCSFSIDKETLKSIVSENNQIANDCFECGLRSRCDNKCGCKNLASNDSLCEISPQVCAHEHILIPIADALWRKSS